MQKTNKVIRFTQYHLDKASDIKIYKMLRVISKDYLCGYKYNKEKKYFEIENGETKERKTYIWTHNTITHKGQELVKFEDGAEQIIRMIATTSELKLNKNKKTFKLPHFIKVFTISNIALFLK